MLEGDINMQKYILSWLFSTLDELIDCEYQPDMEDKVDDAIRRKGSAPPSDDTGESRSNN